jgi:hypothetical protein
MTTPPPARHPALRILDIVGGVVVGVLALVFGFTAVGILSSLQPDPAVCGEGCDSGALAAIVIAGVAAQIFAWALSIGFFLVRAMRRRVAFFWPVVGLVVMIIAFYATTAGVAAWAQSTGVSS